MQAWQRQPAQCIFCALRRASSAYDGISSIRNISTSVAEKQEFRYKPRPRFENKEDGDQNSKRSPRNATRVRANRLFDREPRDERPRSSAVQRSPRNVTGDKHRSSWPERGGTKRQDGGVLLREDGKPLLRNSFDQDNQAMGRRFGRHENDAFQPGTITEALLRRALVDVKVSMNTYKPNGQEKSQMYLLDPNGTKWNAFEQILQKLLEKVSSGQHTTLSAKDKASWATLNTAYRDGYKEFEKQLSFAFMDFTVVPGDRSLSTLDDNLLLDLRFPTEWYSPARKTQRTIHLHVGPTNSGKTYNALKRLQEAKNGFYSGPLRLLAHEVYSRFQANGIACDLVTGDDIRHDDSPDTKVYASTVEMVDCSREVDVAVIDEIQMVGHEERGWAWTRAFLGANAKEVHLCGEDRVVPLIKELAASMGDTLQIHRYQRLNPLKCMPKSLRGNLKSLQKGDCIVAFSVVQIHDLKKQIEVETGKRCAIVYGSLPPETRAEQADLFNDPDNDYDYLVASDAIGMGLNLAIKRIIFNKVTRFDGTKPVLLSVPQIKQIAGRAGRFRTAHQDKHDKGPTTTPNTSAAQPEGETVGWVTTLDEADLPLVSRALSTEAPSLKKAGLNPPAEFLEEINNKLPPGTPFEYLIRTVHRIAETHPRFFLCDVRDRMAGARLIEDVADLTIEQRVNLCAAPISGRNVSLAKCFKALAQVVSKMTPVTIVDVHEIPLEVLAQEPTANREYLQSLEDLHKCLILYLWLSYRFQQFLTDQPMAIHAKELTEQKINWTLRAFSANPLLAKRLQKLRQAADNSSLATETARYRAAMKQMDAEEAADSLAEEQPVEAEPSTSSENPIQELVGDETFDEHFAEPAKFVSEHSVEVLDEAETLKTESKEQMVELTDEEVTAVIGPYTDGKPGVSLGRVDNALVEEDPEQRKTSSGSG